MSVLKSDRCPWLRRAPLGVPARFWVKVRQSENCWEWIGCINAAGYGTLRQTGAEQSSTLAHRISWEIHNGLIPDGLLVLHHCDNPSCVRPDHLFLGTVQDNVGDMVAKGRGHKGMRSGAAKLTDDKVREMRRLHGQGVGTRELSRRFGLSNATASNALRRITWKHVT